MTSYYDRTARDSSIVYVPFESYNQLLVTTESLDSNVRGDSGMVVIANGKELRSILAPNRTSVVYLWSPRCKSDLCYSIRAIEKLAKEKDFDLYVVAEYYDAEKMKEVHPQHHPILGIDVKYYHTDYTSKYLRLFLDDLTLDQFEKQRNAKINFLVFEGNQYVKNIVSLEELGGY
ncbi:MAG: hypothetical protein SchgKO_24130 [Schleiferiaceae bacterium]